MWVALNMCSSLAGLYVHKLTFVIIKWLLPMDPCKQTLCARYFDVVLYNWMIFLVHYQYPSEILLFASDSCDNSQLC